MEHMGLDLRSIAPLWRLGDLEGVCNFSELLSPSRMGEIIFSLKKTIRLKMIQMKSLSEYLGYGSCPVVDNCFFSQ